MYDFLHEFGRIQVVLTQTQHNSRYTSGNHMKAISVSNMLLIHRLAIPRMMIRPNNCEWEYPISPLEGILKIDSIHLDVKPKEGKLKMRKAREERRTERKVIRGSKTK